jgi:hypothetical protein
VGHHLNQDISSKSIQTKLLLKALSLALWLTLARIVLGFLSGLVFGNGLLALSEYVGYLIVGIACLYYAWREGFSPLYAWMAGYLYLWTTLLLLNSQIAMLALGQNVITLILLLLIAPLPGAMSAIVFAIVGHILRRILRKT